MENMVPIKKDIELFLESCLTARSDFISKLKLFRLELNNLKFESVSKYHVTVAGKDTFTRRVKNTFLSEVEFLDTNYKSMIKKLSDQYYEMMLEHRQLNNDWKVKRNWEEFRLEYANLVKDVMEDKANFRTKLDHQCHEIRTNADELLNRFHKLFTKSEDIELKSSETFLTYLLQESSDDVMRSIMANSHD